MDEGSYTFGLIIPPDFQRDVLAGRSPAIQLNVDATRMSQAFTGNGYIQSIVTGEVNAFMAGHREHPAPPCMCTPPLHWASCWPRWRVPCPSSGCLMLTITPLQILSGAVTPRESVPGFVQDLMLAAPNTHFVMIAQAILCRGAGLGVIWPQLIALAIIGTLLFMLALGRFRKTLAAMT